MVTVITDSLVMIGVLHTTRSEIIKQMVGQFG
jgi:hypothetical protein